MGQFIRQEVGLDQTVGGHGLLECSSDDTTREEEQHPYSYLPSTVSFTEQAVFSSTVLIESQGFPQVCLEVTSTFQVAHKSTLEGKESSSWKLLAAIYKENEYPSIDVNFE